MGFSKTQVITGLLMIGMDPAHIIGLYPLPLIMALWFANSVHRAIIVFASNFLLDHARAIIDCRLLNNGFHTIFYCIATT